MNGEPLVVYRGHDTSLQMANWIKEGLLEYADKQRMSEWLSKQRYNSAEVRKLLGHTTNIVISFENPTLEPRG